MEELRVEITTDQIIHKYGLAAIHRDAWKELAERLERELRDARARIAELEAALAGVRNET